MEVPGAGEGARTWLQLRRIRPGMESASESSLSCLFRPQPWTGGLGPHLLHWALFLCSGELVCGA